MANQFLKSGKVKDLYTANGDLQFKFSDRISAFDKVIPTEIPNKGETLARTSAYWFEAVRGLGIPTHYLGLDSPDTMRVRPVRVIHDYSQLTHTTTDYLIPLEFISRRFVYGSAWSRLRRGELTPQQLGFPATYEIKEGERLPHPFYEVTTKLEAFDRPLTREETLAISGLTEKEYNESWEIVQAVDDEIGRRIKGLVHVDGKKELAMDRDRRLMLVDTFGTADEDRFWDAEEHKQGRYVEKSKEHVRQHYQRNGYYDLLRRSREKDDDGRSKLTLEDPEVMEFYRNQRLSKMLTESRFRGETEPPIPPLKAAQVVIISNLYVQLLEQLTGQKFRG